MKNKSWFFVYPRITDEFSYAFLPIPTICINGWDYGVIRRKVKIQLAWLFFGIEFSFEYENKIKAKRIAREWEVEEARLKELKDKNET